MEVLAWFKIHKGKDFASMVRLHMMSLPSSEMINDFEWSPFVDDWTANRRLTEMKIKEHVNFVSAKEFIEEVCGLDGIDTVKGI